MKRVWILIGAVFFLVSGAMRSACQASDLKEQWVERITSAEDHNAMAFRLGPELMRLDPEAGVEIVEECWPRITESSVKTGVLKSFAFGRHPLVLRVLHLGMTDADPEVRRYAAAYLKELALRTFDDDMTAYQAWYGENGDKPIAEVLQESVADLSKRLEGMDAWAGMEILEELHTDLGAAGRKTSYPDLREYAIKAGLPEVFAKWYHDPATPPDVLPGILERLSQLRSDRDFLETEILPLLKNAPSEAMQSVAVRAVSRSDLPEATDLLLDVLTDEYGNRRLWDVATALAKKGDPRVIPTMIGVIDADNSYDTIYGVGYFGLGKLTGVDYSEFHDGAWWRRWWEENKTKYPDEVRNLPIPDLPKTENGRNHVPYPENMDTFEGRTAYLGEMIRAGKLDGLGLSGIARAYAEAGDPRAIPVLIGVILADDEYESVYGVGYFGLGKLTGVSYSDDHDGAWWRQWWEENKSKFSEAAQKQEILDFTEEVAEGRKTIKESATADVADIPSTDIRIGGDAKKRYFLIGPVEGAQPPKKGYNLAIILPGGDGGENFNAFVRRIYKNALGDDWIAAEPVAFKWTLLQRIVWPTRTHPAWGQQFSTEEFVEAVVADVKARFPVNPKAVVTLSWSSGGPAAYAISLQETKSVTGSYVAMSVFRPDWLPALENAKGHRYFIDHSPDDQVCSYADAQAAREQLAKAGATVESIDYKGGHGWRGDVYGRIRAGMNWLTEE